MAREKIRTESTGNWDTQKTVIDLWEMNNRELVGQPKSVRYLAGKTQEPRSQNTIYENILDGFGSHLEVADGRRIGETGWREKEEGIETES